MLKILIGIGLGFLLFTIPEASEITGYLVTEEGWRHASMSNTRNIF